MVFSSFRMGHSTAAITSFCALTLVVVVVLKLSDGCCISFLSFSAFKFDDYFSLPTVKLQRTTSISDQQLRTVGSSAAAAVNHRRNSSPVIHNLSSELNKREELKLGLARARASIREAALNRNHSSSIIMKNLPHAFIYRNPIAFYQSYLEMEKRFKIYVYGEGDIPITHDGPCKDLYTVEGRFIDEMESGDRKFKTSDPHRAHVFFLPFSVTWMVKYLYKPLTYDLTPLKQFVNDYVTVVSTKHPYWNRTSGADHFMLACHDWGPEASRGHPQLFNTSIRVLCNANSSEGFNPQKDVTLPEIHLYGGDIGPKLLSPPPFDDPRRYLIFFAGGLHGPIRENLLQNWKGRDKDVQIFEYLPEHLDYDSFMLQSKYCLCPSGYEVASPRIVEAIYAECVPVILSENYVLPFSDVLRWEALSIQIDVSQIPRLKEVLMAVPEEKYRKLKEGIKAVRRHFVLNQPTKRFDVFHMILHSIWLRRLNMRLR